MRVELGERSYDIVIGAGVLADAGARIAALPGMASRASIITDETVAPLYLDTVATSLANAGIETSSTIVPAGEGSKSFACLERVLEDLIAAGAERTTPLIALGGGVVGDLTGFAASALLRGVPFIQVPTTLLAQVDSSVGGKTGINSRHGKNLVGSFYQPRIVLADTATLATLPARQLRAGYAEVVKYGLIDDPGFYAWLEGNHSAVLNGDAAALQHTVATCCAAKARIVAADERESGQRALLNLGHTFGHAFEAEVGYGADLLHGEAVALGMVLAFRLSARRGHCTDDDAAAVAAHLASAGLPTTARDLPDQTFDATRLIDHMRHDKKVKQGVPSFILVHGIGASFICDDVALSDVETLLKDFLQDR